MRLEDWAGLLLAVFIHWAEDGFWPLGAITQRGRGERK